MLIFFFVFFLHKKVKFRNVMSLKFLDWKSFCVAFIICILRMFALPLRMS